MKIRIHTSFCIPASDGPVEVYISGVKLSEGVYHPCIVTPGQTLETVLHYNGEITEWFSNEEITLLIDTLAEHMEKTAK